YLLIVFFATKNVSSDSYALDEPVGTQASFFLSRPVFKKGAKARSLYLAQLIAFLLIFIIILVYAFSICSFDVGLSCWNKILA
ncbi:MAG: hypothetical protein JW744_03500, partial [Candidatus Diapherotrites archaeon]|nr:hypothetical protein [Candidatus Diapherotrites archaeon]